ncbi:hypothetical protein F0310_02975 [Borrelia sp. A-FGy1]|uniref:integrin-binding adhesin P66 family protein n=1 Tax=Borrelia sp. A-FGy1 TaxID=2608247 RepID=UPI0015F63B9C|nr:integrin-binding adhesin P66 family protein [Borrelia sp. A-FGy1]QMU99366.1 hypothetical protein F0310_02975 [Borrelia sp. A-FGy1]
MTKKLISCVFGLLLTTFTQSFAQETTTEKNEINLDPWKPKFEFENTSEFRLDMDEKIPGLENKSKIGIKFLPFGKNAELGKNDPFSAYIKIEDLALKVEGQKDSTFKLDLGDIITKIKIYDFYIKMNSMTDFDFNQESLFSFAPITSIKSDYYGLPSNDRALRKTILARGTDKKIGTLQFGYKLPQLELILAIGATGTGNRNHGKIHEKDTEEEKKKKKDRPYNNTYAGLLYGTQVKWSPIKNELVKDSPTVIAETPIELNFGVSGAFGNKTFNKSSITYGLKDNAIIGSDLFVPTLSNPSIMTSLGLQYKIGLTKVNNKNIYLILHTGTDLGIDFFASDFSTFGHISKKANTDEKNKFNPAENKLNFGQARNTNFAFSVGANIGLAWNKDEGEKESWEIKGKDSYNTRIFGEQDKKSGIGIGINYGQNLYKPSSRKKLINDIAKKAFKTLNVEISTYEDNKKGILPGIGWIISGGIYDLLKEKPNTDDIIALLNQDATDTKQDTNNISFVNAAKIGAALYVDYAIPVESISSKTYITPYVGTHILGSFKDSDKKLYLKAGIELEKIIKFTTITFGWDSNNLLAKKDKMGSAFLAFKVAFDE